MEFIFFTLRQTYGYKIIKNYWFFCMRLRAIDDGMPNTAMVRQSISCNVVFCSKNICIWKPHCIKVFSKWHKLVDHISMGLNIPQTYRLWEINLLLPCHAFHVSSAWRRLTVDVRRNTQHILSANSVCLPHYILQGLCHPFLFDEPRIKAPNLYTDLYF